MEIPNKDELEEYKSKLEKDYSKFQPRNYQIRVEEALKLKPFDLMSNGEDGRAYISKSDLILIYSIFKGGLIEFYDSYIKFVRELNKDKGYVVVPRPHYFLKSVFDVR